MAQVLTLLKAGPEYRPWHLYRMADTVLKHNPGAEIHCLTDIEISHPGIKPIYRQLPPKWWGKLMLFELFAGPVLYLDIDTVCLGDLSELVRSEPGFTMLPNVYQPGRVGSGVMSWYGDYSYLTRYFTANPFLIMREYTTPQRWGDQAFIEHNLDRQADLFGPECRSYKAHCRHGVPAGARLVYFHGRPRPWQIRARWLNGQY